jgi:hypothetical protein
MKGDAMNEELKNYWLKEDAWTGQEVASFLYEANPYFNVGTVNCTVDDPIDYHYEREYEDIYRGVVSGKLECLERTDDKDVYKGFVSKWLFDPKAACKWMLGKSHKYHAVSNLADDKPVTEEKACKWPWGDYETPNLCHAAAAIEEFSARFMSNDKKDIPTLKDVSDWLISQRKVRSKNMADHIAAVVLPEGRSTGPR